jgi:hypothetical protein
MFLLLFVQHYRSATLVGKIRGSQPGMLFAARP